MSDAVSAGRVAAADGFAGPPNATEAVLRELLEQALVLSQASAGQITLPGPKAGVPGLALAVAQTASGALFGRTYPNTDRLAAAGGDAMVEVAWHDDVAADAGDPLAVLLKGTRLIGVRIGLDCAAGTAGILHLGFAAGRRADAAAAKALGALGRQVALAAAGAIEAEALRSRVEQSRILLEIAGVSTSTLQLDEMLARLVAAAARLTGADRASIWLLSEDGQRLLPSAMYGVDESFLQSWKRGEQRLDDQQLSREALATGRPVVVVDAAIDPRTDKVAVQFFGDKSLLIAPLVVGTRAIGTLYLNHVQMTYPFTEAEVEIAMAIASQATAAIENARLYRESEVQRERLRDSFRRLGDALGSAYTLDETLQLVVQIAAEIVSAQACVLELVDAAGGGPDLRTSVGLDPSVAQELGKHLQRGTPDGHEPQRVARRLAELLAAGRAGRRTGDSLGKAPASFGIPLSVGGERIGSLSVAGKGSEEFTTDEIELLRGFAGGAALAIQRSRLQAEVQARLEHLSGLYSLSQAISTLGDFNETLAHVVDQIARVLDVERCVILLLDESGRHLVGHSYAYGLSHERATSITLSKEEVQASWQVLQTASPLVSNDCQNDDRIITKYVRQFGDVNLLIAPMRVGETPVGVIRASNKPPPGFTDGDVRLVNIFATQAAVIVQNAKLFRDVTREAEQLEALIGGASDGIVIVDSEGRIVRFNAAMEALTGWPAREALGRDCDAVVPAAEPDGTTVQGGLLLKQALATGQPISYREAVVWNRTGRLVDVGASYSITIPPRGGSPIAVAIVRDISAIKEVERMKSDFVSLVSHEFRTPLALIKGYIATLLRPDLRLNADTARRFEVGINQAADRLVLIVNNLLNTSRIESGLFRPNLRPVELKPLVNRVVSDMSESAQGRLEVAWKGEDFNVVADSEQIALVLSNLVGNAIKYGRGETDLLIRVLVEGRPEDIKISVSDRGHGIPPEIRARVFEKFYRGPDGLRAPGSGLGLYICQKVVEAHGGTIGIENEREPGTRIAFTLPRAPQPSSASRMH